MYNFGTTNTLIKIDNISLSYARREWHKHTRGMGQDGMNLIAIHNFLLVTENYKNV